MSHRKSASVVYCVCRWLNSELYLYASLSGHYFHSLNWFTFFVEPVSIDLCEPCSPPASLSALLSDSPFLAALLHAVTHLPLHSGLCVFMPRSHCLHCYMTVWSAPLSSRCDRGQRVLRAGLTSCCCNPTDTPTGRGTDGPTDKEARRLDVFIAPPPMHPHSKLRGQTRPEAPAHPEYVVFIMWHPQVCTSGSSLYWENTGTASGSGVVGSLQVNHRCVSHLQKRCASWNVRLPRLMNTLCYTSANNKVRICA